VKKVLKDLGISAWLVQSGKVKVNGGWMNLATKGTSDIIGFMPYTGRILAVETKEKGKMPTKEQVEFLGSVQKAHGCGMVVDELKLFVDWIVYMLEEDKQLGERLFVG
jgi:hypothetical protein